VNDCPNHIKKDRSTKRQTGAELPRGRRDMGRRIASIALKQTRRDQDESSSLFGLLSERDLFGRPLHSIML